MSDPALFGPEVTDDRPPHQRSAWETFKNQVGKVRNDAPDTSHEAARLIAPKSGSKRAQVLSAVAQSNHRGMTDEEIQEFCGMNPSTERPRRVELVEMGWIEDSGHRGRVASGNRAAVWVLTERGKAAL